MWAVSGAGGAHFFPPVLQRYCRGVSLLLVTARQAHPLASTLQEHAHTQRMGGLSLRGKHHFSLSSHPRPSGRLPSLLFFPLLHPQMILLSNPNTEGCGVAADSHRVSRRPQSTTNISPPTPRSCRLPPLLFVPPQRVGADGPPPYRRRRQKPQWQPRRHPFFNISSTSDDHYIMIITIAMHHP